jgi:hypothetical protein
MPFEPKLVRSDDSFAAAEGSLELPPELAVLGDALRTDAQQLADCFPPPHHAASPASLAAQTLRRRWVWRRLGGAAALLLVGFVIAWQTFAPQRPTGELLSAAVEGGRSPADAAHAAPRAEARRLTRTDASKTIRLTELTGPELEALVDLVQREPCASTSVSF